MLRGWGHPEVPMNELRLVVHTEPDPEADRLLQSALEVLADALAERAINAARARREAGLSTAPEAPPRRARRA